MATYVKCPHCAKQFPLDEAIRHEWEEKIVSDERAKHQAELESVKKQIEQKVRQETDDRVNQELKDKADQIKKLQKRAQDAEAQELKIRQEKRDLEESKQKFELEKQRQLDEERDKIREKAQQEIEARDKFKFAEYEKKLTDMQAALEVAKRKGDQSSQQLQGEVLELDVETTLKAAFPNDDVLPVAKGQQGGDIIHRVKGKSGRMAGVILWETKRAKWSSTWLVKLREDARKEDASIAVLLTIDLPKDIKDFKLIQGTGTVVCSYKYALALASILRRSVLQTALAKQTAENKDENLEMLYNYIQSEAFRHRFEAFAEGVRDMENDLDYEKRAMERIWKKREMQIKKTLQNAARMYGELQGVMGNALPDIKTFSLPASSQKQSE